MMVCMNESNEPGVNSQPSVQPGPSPLSPAADTVTRGLTPPPRPLTVPARQPGVVPADGSSESQPQTPTPAPVSPTEPDNQTPSEPPATVLAQPAAAAAQEPLQPPADVVQKATFDDHKRSLLNNARGFMSFVAFVATVVIAALLINQFIFQSYYVDGTSMTPTLQNNDRLIIDKTGKTLAAVQNKPYIPARGSIVILDSTILDQYGHDEQLIKRVIGLPDETVHIENGVVTIKNSQRPDGFNADQELGLRLAPTYSQSTLDITVPEGDVFVMGDNRSPNGSFDSRAFGPVPSNKIQGRLAMRIFPFDHIKTF
jgi:signal peptidase I